MGLGPMRIRFPEACVILIVSRYNVGSKLYVHRNH